MFKTFLFRIRKNDGIFYQTINKITKAISCLNIPYLKFIYQFLWWERKFRLLLFAWFLKVFYYTPLFKAACFKVGKNLDLVSGLPYINENLKIIIGDNVCVYAKETGFSGGKIQETPVLKIGSHTYIGPGVKIGICKEITIGDHCLIAARVFMSDHDGHPVNWQKRREQLPVDIDSVSPILIEDDVWIGEGAYICKGIKIGRGAIIGARSVVTKDVEPFTVVGGNPAKLIKSITD